MRRKIVIIGLSTLAVETAERLSPGPVADVVLLDSDEGAAQVAAGDLAAAAAGTGGPAARVRAAGSWEAAAGADVVVVCDGDPVDAARGVAERCPGAVVVVALDPVEEACAAVLAEGRFPRGRVLGVAGSVEALRLRAGVARALDVSVADVDALVLGGRGERAVPVLSALRAGGSAVADKLAAERIARLVAALRTAPPAAVRAVAAATAGIVTAVCRDARALIPAAMLCEGELGISNAVTGVPVVLGASGVEQVLDVVLTGDEREALSAAAVPFAR